MTTQAIEKKPAGQMSLQDLIAAKRDSFAQVAAAHYDADRLVKLSHVCVTRTPKLGECTPTSVLMSLMRCAELGLEPDSALRTRCMWLVPRWNNKIRKYECTYVIDYRAQLQLARDTGLVTSLVANEVRERDEWELTYSDDGGSIAKFRHAPAVFEDRGKVIGYYAAARLKGGEVQVVAMSVADAQAFRDKFAAKTKDGRVVGPWTDNEGPMSLKTCLRKLFNLLPAGQSAAARKFQEAATEEAYREEVEPFLEGGDEAPALPVKSSRTDDFKAQLREQAQRADEALAADAAAAEALADAAEQSTTEGG